MYPRVTLDRSDADRVQYAQAVVDVVPARYGRSVRRPVAVGEQEGVAGAFGRNAHDEAAAREKCERKNMRIVAMQDDGDVRRESPELRVQENTARKLD